MKKNIVLKIVSAMVCVAMLCMMMACTISFDGDSTYSESYNGITKTVKTTTVNGEEETTIEYTDENGNVMDAAAGEAAFESARAACEGDDDADDDADASETEGETLYHAELKVVNNTDKVITGFYVALAEDEDWGTDILGDESIAIDGEATLNGTMTYDMSTSFQVRAVAEDGTEINSNPFTFGDLGLEDTANITIKFSGTEGEYAINIY